MTYDVEVIVYETGRREAERYRAYVRVGPKDGLKDGWIIAGAFGSSEENARELALWELQAVLTAASSLVKGE